MTSPMDQRLARVRGKLTPAGNGLGARGLERVARNPACLRLRGLTLAGISAVVALEFVYGDPSDDEQSPFAISTGNQFEQQLFDSGAARLIEAYRQAGRLSADECKVIVVPDLAPETKRTDIWRAQRRTITNSLFRRKLGGDASAPNLIIKPRIIVRLLGVEYEIEPDALVATDTDPFYRVVEIKSYTDRAGKTDPGDLRSAARQAAVGAYGLRTFISGIPLLDPIQLVPPFADLVLKRVGSFRPSLRSLPIESELFSLYRVGNEAARDLDELEASLDLISPTASLDDPEVLDAIPNNYVTGCREHCALHRRCKAQGITAGDPMLLGPVAREDLAAAGSIGRVLELLRGESARSSEERGLQQRLLVASTEYERAVNG